MPGLFITFEGPEGAGKSTQVELLRRALADQRPVVVREPGGTPLGEEVRRLLLHGEAMSPIAEMYLFMAARAELLAKVIEPALAAGRLVIADRYHDSTIAYQGGGRGLDVSWPAAFRRPDRTYLLMLPPEGGLRRAAGAESGGDRLELEPLDFHRRVFQAYDRLAAAEPERVLRVDARAAPEHVHHQVLADARRLLGRMVPSSS